MIRLGLCCKFSEEPIRYRTTTVTYLKRLALKGEDPNLHLNAIIKNNIEALQSSILYCANNNIGCFRVGSDFFPSITHPDIKYTLDHMQDAKSLRRDLAFCKNLAKEKNIRLTFHPSQFVILNSPKKDVVVKSLADLEYHADLAELIGADVINIHMGGAYNDKKSALERFASNFKKLSLKAQKKLTLENDDKTYSPSELLPTCKNLDIPLVYDVHHHRCNKDHLSIEEATEKALDTWNREPLFHISSPKDGWDKPKPFKHHDFIVLEDFPQCWQKVPKLTVEIEAKAKEIAIEKLRLSLIKNKWAIYPNNI